MPGRFRPASSDPRQVNHMEKGPLKERRVDDRRRVPDRRRVERRVQGERRTSQILMPADLNRRRQGLDGESSTAGRSSSGGV